MYFDYSWIVSVTQPKGGSASNMREEDQRADTQKSFSNTRRIEILEQKLAKLEKLVDALNGGKTGPVIPKK